ncbi:hypothetical protein [Lewinella sp. 4G2]|uniref:hypothetical protein n=1 Tax=Lewinella sp. 4G2 TaxID=1803372 RepID=UPI0007B470A3|nr:hypothetical protein [Lewinella sp. 4G2]OAV46188.1 hypothetical protein A3850_018185 [Lewinella sp. 4G2]
MMNATKNHQSWVLALLIAINFLFVWKYGQRVTRFAPVLALAVAGGQALMFTSTIYDKLLRRISPTVLWSMLAIGWVAAAAFVHYRVDLEGLNVDRWSVISSFLEALEAGGYPYLAESHRGNPPGPMPVYHFLAYPFYKVGWLVLLAIIGPIAGTHWLTKSVDHDRRINALLLLVGSSAWLYWEILVRSNVITFTILVLLGLAAWAYAIKAKANWPKLGLLAVATGLLLATRSVFGLAYLLIFGSLLLQRLYVGRVVVSAIISLVTFALIFLPFYLAWPEEFMVINPFIVQGGFLVPHSFVAGFFLLATGLLAYPPARARPFIWSGYLLFLIVGVYFAFHVWQSGFDLAFHGSKVDLSYFLFSVPFLICGLFNSDASQPTLEGDVA